MIKAVSDETPVDEIEIEDSQKPVDEGSDEFEEFYDADAEEYEEFVAEDDDPSVRRQWVAPTIALTVIAAWTGFFVWANRSEMLAGGTPQQWTGWITSWAIPVLLVVSLWMLAVRNSRREARRFGEVARSLSEESVRLEVKLAAVNRELSLAISNISVARQASGFPSMPIGCRA